MLSDQAIAHVIPDCTGPNTHRDSCTAPRLHNRQVLLSRIPSKDLRLLVQHLRSDREIIVCPPKPPLNRLCSSLTGVQTFHSEDTDRHNNRLRAPLAPVPLHHPLYNL